jgi:hypothetical protein
LPPEAQNRLAEALEDALHTVTQALSSVTSDVHAAIGRALEQHAASAQYLKDK